MITKDLAMMRRVGRYPGGGYYFVVEPARVLLGASASSGQQGQEYKGGNYDRNRADSQA
jgi:hypothetical protein